MVKIILDGAVLQGVYAVTVILSLAFQVLIGNIFGVGEELAYFFLINAVTNMGVIIFSDYVQLTLIHNVTLIQVAPRFLGKFGVLVSRNLSVLLILAIVCLMISIAITLGTDLLAHRVDKWIMPLALTLAAMCSMISSMILLVEQLSGRVALPTLVHPLAPIASIGSVIILESYGASLALPAAMVIGGILQIAYLLAVCSSSVRSGLMRGVVFFVFGSTIKRHYQAFLELFVSKRLMFSGLFPFLQLVERYLFSVLSAPLVAASAYAWSFAMALYSVSQKGFVFFAAVEERTQREASIGRRMRILLMASLITLFVWVIFVLIIRSDVEGVISPIRELFSKLGSNQLYVMAIPFLVPWIAFVSFFSRIKRCQSISSWTIAAPVLASFVGVMFVLVTDVLLIQFVFLVAGLSWITIRMFALFKMES